MLLGAMSFWKIWSALSESLAAADSASGGGLELETSVLASLIRKGGRILTSILQDVEEITLSNAEIFGARGVCRRI